MVGALAAATYVDGPIAISEATLQNVKSLFVEGSEYIPFQNILQGLLSFSWGGFYVELYRCIEQLYAVPRLIELTKDWPTDKSFVELAELLESRLSWRPKEDESLCKILEECSAASVSSVIAAFELAIDANSTVAHVAGRGIYALRNHLVHFRGKPKIAPLKEEKWDRIMTAMLSVIADSYSAFGKSFHEFDGA